MTDLQEFERIARLAHLVTEADDNSESHDEHPFDTRNIHPDLPVRTRELFDDGYFAESTFEAFKFIEQEIKRISKLVGTGFGLMMQAFDENKPKVQLSALATESEIDEQRGFRHMFAGAQSALRNPRGHGTDLVDTPDVCLDHLSVASVLLRRLDDAGLR